MNLNRAKHESNAASTSSSVNLALPPPLRTESMCFASSSAGRLPRRFIKYPNPSLTASRNIMSSKHRSSIPSIRFFNKITAGIISASFSGEASDPIRTPTCFKCPLNAAHNALCARTLPNTSYIRFKSSCASPSNILAKSDASSGCSPPPNMYPTCGSITHVSTVFNRSTLVIPSNTASHRPPSSRSRLSTYSRYAPKSTSTTWRCDSST
mmetsp:Transcript_12900/g.37034  ORF Transcript_12900/g.37034 Transcript_12900/m.37034 type:complete len:210 (+) Transcript_12900:992-1621(+)